MRCCLGQNISASLPKLHQTAKAASKTLMVKGVPTEVSEKDFKEFLDLNQIIYAMAECLTSKKDGRVLQMFKLEIEDEAEAKALISQNPTCHITGIMYKVEEFQFSISIQQCWNCQNFGHLAKHVGGATITKDALIERKSSQNVPAVKDHMLLPTKSVQRIKRQAFRQHVVDNQKSYVAILCQAIAPPQLHDKTFTFPAEQLVTFVANVAIQVAQPQVC